MEKANIEKNGFLLNRFGIIVSKKISKKAVERNRLKRQFREAIKNFDKEIRSRDIGEIVMDKLAKLDDVAYVRFASVYRQFKDVNQFMEELRGVLKKK